MYVSPQMDPVQKAVINHTFGIPLVKTKRPVISCNVCQIRFNSEVLVHQYVSNNLNSEVTVPVFLYICLIYEYYALCVSVNWLYLLGISQSDCMCCIYNSCLEVSVYLSVLFGRVFLSFCLSVWLPVSFHLLEKNIYIQNDSS